MQPIIKNEFRSPNVLDKYSRQDSNREWNTMKFAIVYAKIVCDKSLIRILMMIIIWTNQFWRFPDFFRLEKLIVLKTEVSFIDVHSTYGDLKIENCIARRQNRHSWFYGWNMSDTKYSNKYRSYRSNRIFSCA